VTAPREQLYSGALGPNYTPPGPERPDDLEHRAMVELYDDLSRARSADCDKDGSEQKKTSRFL
jgi:hypothetical protein